MNHIPVAVGLVLCEQIIVDEKTRNLTPVNCFSARKLDGFPGAADFHVVAWLADGLGSISVAIAVRKLNTLDEVFRLERQLRFQDPLKDMRFTAHIRGCPFPEAGYYEVILTADGEFVAHRKIAVFE